MKGGHHHLLLPGTLHYSKRKKPTLHVEDIEMITNNHSMPFDDESERYGIDSFPQSDIIYYCI